MRLGFFSKSCGSAPGQHNPRNCRQYLDDEQNNQQRNHDPHVDPEAAELIVCHGVSNILVAPLTFQRRSRHVPLMFRRERKYRNLHLAWRAILPVQAADEGDLLIALDAVSAHRLASSAQRPGVGHLLTEDMQDGFVLQGVTFINPFKQKYDRLIAELLPLSWSGQKFGTVPKARCRRVCYPQASCAKVRLG